jgi:hypothetical protein
VQFCIEEILYFKTAVMKKIIIALDGTHFPKGAFEFAKYINNSSDILLAGIFLSPIDYSKLLAFSGMEGIALMPEWLMRNEDDEIVNKNIHLFEEACVKEGIQYRIHKDNDLSALASLVEESRFADVLLVSSELFYENVQKQQPNFYLEEVLKKAECSVVLIPEKFTEPQQVVLTYDGSESSVFAVKQFAYLFPEFTRQETVLVSINKAEAVELPEYNIVTELVSRHYPSLQITNLPMVDRKDFAVWMEEQPNSFITIGAYSRSMFPALFKKSFASTVIHDLNMPIFISHK